MTYDPNKFMQLSRDSLIRGVQDLAIRLADQKEKKRHKTASYLRSMAHLREARAALVAKLPEKDRNKPEFFPIGSHVSYKKEMPIDDLYDFNVRSVVAPPRNGIITQHDGDMLHVRLEGDAYDLKIWPAHAKLRFIKSFE